MSTRVYNSSLGYPDVSDIEPRHRVSWPGRVVAFEADLADGLPEEFHVCDLIYAEPPWSPGESTEFLNRAGIDEDDGRWQRSLDSLVDQPQGPGIPVVIVAGVRVQRALPMADVERPIWLSGPGRNSGVPARVMAFGLDELPVATSSEELLRALAVDFKVVGDPCCGFGNTGRIFVKAGRKAILSDVNPHCIGYIAKTMRTWGFGLE